MPEPVVYDKAVEGLFLRSLSTRVTPQCKARLRELGLDLDHALKPTYSKAQWQGFLRIAIEELFPKVPLTEAYRQLGELLADGVRNTLWGNTVATLARLLGPQRGLLRIQDGLMGINNFMSSRLTQVNATTYDLWISDVYSLPTYVQGCLLGAIRVTGAKDPAVDILRQEAEGVTYRVRWRA